MLSPYAVRTVDSIVVENWSKLIFITAKPKEYSYGAGINRGDF